jgi:hypothetical protein
MLSLMMLGAFEKLQKMTVSFITWTNLVSTGQIFMTFDIQGFLENLSRK